MQEDNTQPMPYADATQQNNPYYTHNVASGQVGQEVVPPPPNDPYEGQNPAASTQYYEQGAVPPQSDAYHTQDPAAPTVYNMPSAQEAVPPAQKRPSRKRLLLIVAGAILVLLLLGGGGFLFLPGLLARNNNQAATTSTTTAPTPRANRNIYAPYLAQYGPTIRSKIAQGLHLTPAQLATQLRSGKTLSAIATAQGVANSQLQTLISNAFQSGLQPAIDSGGLTQKQVTTLIRRMQRQPQALARFLEVRARNNATPGATPTSTNQ